MKPVLSQESIHHVKNPAGCPYCCQYDMDFAGKAQDQDTPEEALQRKQLDDHRELAHDQRTTYIHDLQCLWQGTNNRHNIIVHDFLQVTTTKHNFQAIFSWLMKELGEGKHDRLHCISLQLIIWLTTMRNLWSKLGNHC